MNSTLGSTATNPRILGWMSTAIVLSFWSQAQVDRHSSPIAATIDATQVKGLISKYMSGMFIQHIGNLINDSLWSEMLDDRKFYFAIDSNPEPQPAGAPNPIRERMHYKKWRPVGPEACSQGAGRRRTTATSPGSATYPLDISAAFTDDRKFLYWFAVASVAAGPQIEPGMTALSMPEQGR